MIAVDISQKFLDHIQATSREAGQRNVDTLLATADSTELPADVGRRRLHLRHLSSLRVSAEDDGLAPAGAEAGRPGGPVDFRRIPGTSTDWVLNHVRAGQEVFEAEIMRVRL